MYIIRQELLFNSSCFALVSLTYHIAIYCMSRLTDLSDLTSLTSPTSFGPGLKQESFHLVELPIYSQLPTTAVSQTSQCSNNTLFASLFASVMVFLQRRSLISWILDLKRSVVKDSLVVH